MRSIVFSLILLAFSASCVSGQTPAKGDTVLYLLFEEKGNYKNVNSRAVDPLTHEWIPVVSYSIHDAHFYDGHPLAFISQRKDLIDTLSVEFLKKYPLVTFDQLKSFIEQNYKKGFVGYQGRNYFDRLKHIYLVEKDRKEGIATITEVRLDVTIE